MKYAVIMAGGSGKRLWPLSRENHPKQMLKLFNGQTLLRRCFDRLCGMFEPKNILVVTNAGYADMVLENLPEIPAKNVFAEPISRDTAGAIGFAAIALHKYDPNSTMAVVTADQLIEPNNSFQEAMQIAIDFVEEHSDALLTFGVKPTFASSQYGYIKMKEEISHGKPANIVRQIEEFKEKPDEETAKGYIENGQFYWNSGMFVWKTKAILDCLHRFLPDSIEPLCKIQMEWGGTRQEDALREWFPRLPKVSIDYAVMEKATNIYGIVLDCCWRDLGSFTALEDIIESDAEKNIVAARETELLDCKNSIIVTEDAGHLIALIGVENMVVAHSPDATLICPVNQSHRLKELLEQIQKHGGKSYL